MAFQLRGRPLSLIKHRFHVFYIVFCVAFDLSCVFASLFVFKKLGLPLVQDEFQATPAIPELSNGTHWVFECFLLVLMPRFLFSFVFLGDVFALEMVHFLHLLRWSSNIEADGSRPKPMFFFVFLSLKYILFAFIICHLCFFV